MITEIVPGIFTGAFIDLVGGKDSFQDEQIVDVRDLVDKAGNNVEHIVEYAATAKRVFEKYGRVIIVCDMGVSRSRIVAVTLLALLNGSVDKSLDTVLEHCGNPPINPDLIQDVRGFFRAKEKPLPGSGKRIIIGSRGFVGSSIYRFLEMRGEVVYGIHRGNHQLDDLVGLIRVFEQTHASDVIYAINEKSFHSHLAVSQSIGALKNVLEACRFTQKRLVFLSSMVVFGGNARASSQADYYASEDLVPIPYGNYSESKYLCEQLIQVYAQSYDLEYVVIRPSALYGPGMRAQWIINRFIEKAFRNEDILTHEYLNGKPRFEFLHIDSFLEGFYIAIDQDKSGTVSRALNIGSGRLTSTFDLAEKIACLAGSSSTCGLKTISERTHNVCTVPGLVRSRGWNDSVDFDAGLRSCIEAARHAENYSPDTNL